jgi:hypothetical protein
VDVRKKILRTFILVVYRRKLPTLLSSRFNPWVRQVTGWTEQKILMASKLPCFIPVRSYLEEPLCRMESTDLLDLHTYVQVLFFPKHKIGVLFVVLKSTHLLTSHRWCDSNTRRKKSLLCVHRYSKVRKCSVSCLTCTAYYIAPERTITCSLWEEQRKQKKTLSIRRSITGKRKCRT